MKTIRELREARGWKQLDLAYQLGVTPATIYNWESGKHNPNALQLRKLAQLFDVSMDIIELAEKPDTKIAA